MMHSRASSGLREKTEIGEGQKARKKKKARDGGVSVFGIHRDEIFFREVFFSLGDKFEVTEKGKDGN